MRLSEAVRWKIVQKSLSARELAKAVKGVSHDTITRFVKGYDISSLKLDALAEYVGVYPADGGEPGPTIPEIIDGDLQPYLRLGDRVRITFRESRKAGVPVKQKDLSRQFDLSPSRISEMVRSKPRRIDKRRG